MDEFMGAVKLLTVHYEPQDWLRCDGRLLRIEDYQPLFSLLGNRFGGDGVETFALPKMAPVLTDARVEIHYHICVVGIWPQG